MQHFFFIVHASGVVSQVALLFLVGLTYLEVNWRSDILKCLWLERPAPLHVSLILQLTILGIFMVMAGM